MDILFTGRIIRELYELEKDLQNEAYEKINLFKDVTNHKALKVHKLHGRLKDWYSFSVNYKYRIVFQYEGKNKVIMLAIGDHDIYK